MTNQGAFIVCLFFTVNFSLQASDTASVSLNKKSSENRKPYQINKKFSWGPELGVNLTRYTPLDNNFVCFNYAFGADADYRFLKKMSVQIALRCLILSYRHEIGITDVVRPYKEKEQNYFSYLTFPIYLTYFPTEKGFFVFTGPQLGILLSAYGSTKFDYYDGGIENAGASVFDAGLFNAFSAAYDLGIGYRFHFARVQPCLKLGFSQGITKVWKQSDIANYSQEGFLSASVFF